VGSAVVELNRAVDEMAKVGHNILRNRSSKCCLGVWRLSIHQQRRERGEEGVQKELDNDSNIDINNM
jgi:hypothetical protein